MGVSIVRVPGTHRLTFDVYIPRDLSGKVLVCASRQADPNGREFLANRSDRNGCASPYSNSTLVSLVGD